MVTASTLAGGVAHVAGGAEVGRGLRARGFGSEELNQMQTRSPSGFFWKRRVYDRYFWCCGRRPIMVSAPMIDASAGIVLG